MALNNGVMERMKAAVHRLVDMEIERNPTIRDADRYRKSRLPEVLREHEAEWRAAYMATPSITISQLVSMVTGYRETAQRVSKAKAEQNMADIKAMMAEPIDPEVNARGLARARAALRHTS